MLNAKKIDTSWKLQKADEFWTGQEVASRILAIVEVKIRDKLRRQKFIFYVDHLCICDFVAFIMTLQNHRYINAPFLMVS